MLRRSTTTLVGATARRAMSTKTIPSWATVDPWTMSAATPAVGKNLCGGVWSEAKAQHAVIEKTYSGDHENPAVEDIPPL